MGIYDPNSMGAPLARANETNPGQSGVLSRVEILVEVEAEQLLGKRTERQPTTIGYPMLNANGILIIVSKAYSFLVFS